MLADLGTANGTFVNGRRLTKPAPLAVGDRVDVGPFALRFDGESLEGTSRANNIELVADGLTRTVTDRGTGKPLTLLDDVSLVVRPKEFVCIIGPSGSGKSTLLAMLSGRAAPDGGRVLVNGRDLYRHFAALKPDIAVVPQKDLLHDTLSVGAALRYTAELRLPGDAGPADIEASVGDILGVVGLGHRRGTPIRLLSGGQLKRASLANELLCKPSLLFLDEVTSGLDEQTDREVMDLFRLVADGGKTVVCVTHGLANVEATCSLVVVLTVGGKLAFVGTPGEAKGYFGVARLGDVYAALAARPADDWRDQFRASPFHRRYVADRLSRPCDDDTGRSAAGDEQPPARPLRQAWVLTRRYLAVWRGDRAAVLALAGQSLLVAVLLAAVFGRLADVANPAERSQRTVNLLFLLAVSSFWLGCNTAAKEVVKERTIYARERGRQPAGRQLSGLQTVGTNPDRAGPGDTPVRGGAGVVRAAGEHGRPVAGAGPAGHRRHRPRAAAVGGQPDGGGGLGPGAGGGHPADRAGRGDRPADRLGGAGRPWAGRLLLGAAGAPAAPTGGRPRVAGHRRQRPDRAAAGRRRTRLGVRSGYPREFACGWQTGRAMTAQESVEPIASRQASLLVA